ncbi:MAG: hypothetical protein AAF600_08015 [Bacteroidota bacterium]
MILIIWGDSSKPIFIFFLSISFFTDGSFLEYAIFPIWQNINFNFAPLGVPIPQDNYYYTRHEINFNTDQSAKLSVFGSVNWGSFYNGKRTTLEGGIRFAPIPHTTFTLDYEYNDLNSLGEIEEDEETHLTTIGSRFALNPRLQLSAFYQYNTFDEQGRWNIRASWEYQPLSFVYLVFNDTQIDGLKTPFQET